MKKRDSGIDIGELLAGAALGPLGEAATEFASDVIDDVSDAIEDVLGSCGGKKKVVLFLLALLGLGGVMAWRKNQSSGASGGGFDGSGSSAGSSSASGSASGGASAPKGLIDLSDHSGTAVAGSAVAGSAAGSGPVSVPESDTGSGDADASATGPSFFAGAGSAGSEADAPASDSAPSDSIQGDSATGNSATDALASDDIERVEGIGPKIGQALRSAGIGTFAKLADATEDQIKDAIREGGIKIIPTVNTWAKQAAMLRDGDEEGFIAYTDRLVAGRDEG